MNTNTIQHATRPTAQAIHADDAGTRAYWVARRLGADPFTARRAYDSAYAEAKRGER